MIVNVGAIYTYGLEEEILAKDGSFYTMDLVDSRRLGSLETAHALYRGCMGEIKFANLYTSIHEEIIILSMPDLPRLGLEHA